MIQRIRAARPWVIVAVVLAVALALYFAAQSALYIQASQDTTSARDQSKLLKRTLRATVKGTEKQEALLVANLVRLEDLRRLFDYPDTDTLLTIMSEIAADTRVELNSVNVGKVKIEALGVLQYHIQPISVSIDGPSGNIQDFLAALYDRVPVLAATDTSMSNLDDDPVTKLKLLFYLSPELVPEEEG